MSQEIKKISKLTFKDKINDVQKTYKDNKKKIKIEHSNALKKNLNKQEKRVANKKYKAKLKTNKNRYALIYNSIRNEELYRRGAKETKISLAKKNYKIAKNSKVDFDVSVESEKLKLKLKRIKKTYSHPVSRKYRKSRSTRTETDSFVTLPVDTPFKRNVKALLLVLLAAILSTFALDVFVKPFGIYSAGLRGISQTIFYVIRDFNSDVPTSVSYALFIGLNIPLAIFGYIYVGKKFTIYTILFLVLQYLMSIVFDYTHFRELVKPFGLNSEETTRIYSDSTLKLKGFDYAIPVISSLIGSVIYGISVGILYKAGSSTGGSKFVVTWLSIKKQVSIGKIAILLSLFVVFQGILINKVILNHENVFTAYTSITMFATLIFAFSSNFVLDLVFAKSKKEVISVITDKKNEIIRFLDVKFMYNRTFNVSKTKTNFHKREKYKMEFLVSKTESAMLVKLFSQLDKEALIRIIPVSKAQGKIYSQWFE